MWNPNTEDMFAFELQYHYYPEQKIIQTEDKIEHPVKQNSRFDQLCKVSHTHPFQQKFSQKLRHFLVVRNIEMADRDAVTAFSF